MNTLGILHEQRKTIENKVASLKADLEDIEVAVRAIESRKGSRQISHPPAEAPKSVLASGMRPRPIASSA